MQRAERLLSLPAFPEATLMIQDSNVTHEGEPEADMGCCC
jgi:hypothetical protein